MVCLRHKGVDRLHIGIADGMHITGKGITKLDLRCLAIGTRGMRMDICADLCVDVGVDTRWARITQRRVTTRVLAGHGYCYRAAAAERCSLGRASGCAVPHHA